MTSQLYENSVLFRLQRMKTKGCCFMSNAIIFRNKARTVWRETDRFINIFPYDFSDKLITKCIEKQRARECLLEDKAEMRKLEEREDTESLIQPTMQAFHVWNLDIINNTYSSIQYSRLPKVKVQV